MITYTPNPSFTGTDSFTYRVTNPDGVAAVGTVTVTVIGGVTVGPDELTVDVGEAVLFELGANDFGVGQGTTYVARDPLPAGLTLSIDGVLSGVPTSEFSGTILVDVVSGVDATVYVSELVLIVVENAFVGDPVVAPALVSGVTGSTDASRIARAQARLASWETEYNVTSAAMKAARDGTA